MKKEIKVVLLFLFLIVQLLTIGIVLINHLFFTNTLANNQKWKVSKTQLFNPGYDGTTFRDFLPALAKNSLNLSAWRGYHEVVSAETVDWKKLSLRFLPSRGSYLYIIFDKTDEYFSALRISYSPFYESALVTAKYTGEFIKQVPIRDQSFDGDGWQKIIFERDSSNSQDVRIFYKENIIATYNIDAASQASGKIAFRAGKNQILVDDVLATGNENQILVKENFDNLDSFFEIFFIWVFLVSCLDCILLLFLFSKEKKLKFAIRLNFAVCNILILINIFLLIIGPIIRSRYPKGDSAPGRSIIGLSKKIDGAENSPWLQHQSTSLISKYSLSNGAHSNNSENSRIMIIGSSQTAGEGSALEGEDFVSQFSYLVNSNFIIYNKKFEVINASLSGESAKSMSTYFRHQWLQLKPNLVIVNASSNDESYGTDLDFSLALENFIYLSKKYNFRLVFVAEANSVEKNLVLKNHRIMQDLAEDNQIVFINMHEYLADQQNSGIVWWDFVHPTSFGYKLIAGHLFDSLKTELLEMN